MRRGPRLPLAVLQPLLIDAPPPRGPHSPIAVSHPLDWSVIFGNNHPVELEVGFGKGLFLFTESQRRPHVNFIGVEIERKYVLATATRLAKRGLTNVRLAASDARWFFRAKVKEGSLQAVHVYFPDPWWKNRHRKRKLLTQEFLEEACRVLQTGGTLHLATDVEAYFVETQAMFQSLPALQALPSPEANAPAHDLDYLSNFERKYRKEGKPIYRAAYRRVHE